MKRRTFLSLSGATLASTIHPTFSFAQTPNKVAIVIGIDKSGTLPVLRAAASGATQFGDWLEGEGFEVKRFIDSPTDKVKIDPIFEEIDRIVSRGTYQQLVLYFSGHGFLNSYRELWMLSDAPKNPNQAISLLECERLCKRSGIPNVVFISDACRSTATSLVADAVRGSVVFPTTSNSGSVNTKVDTFLATQEGDPAYEVGVKTAADNYQGIFTASFLDAFKFPDDSMVSKVGDIEVVKNRDLEDYLRRDVNRRAQLASIALEQRPEANVASDGYIGRVRRTGQPVNLPQFQPSISEVSTFAFSEKGFKTLASAQPIKAKGIENSGKAMAFTAAKEKIIVAEQRAPKSFETETGFFISGAEIEDVKVNEDFFSIDRVHNANDGSVLVLYPRNNVPSSVAIRFADGTGTVVAGLKGYIGTIVVDEGRVVNVTYTRTDMAGFAESPEGRRLTELRSLVATSARFGTFRISGSGEERAQRARELADKVRMLKRADPTLGIYAAYAYAEADILRQVKSVSSYMRGDINGDIFDVALLAKSLSDKAPDNRKGIAPFCPMLSQGWGLLRIENVPLYPLVDAARDFIEPALWTTFRKEGMDMVLRAMEEGRLI